MTKYAPVVELSQLDGKNGFRINGEAEGSNSGWSVAAAGDFNHDGYADLIIGAPDDLHNGAHSGTAYVVFGAANGFGTKLDLYALDGNNGFRMFGGSLGDKAGWSVSSAGDINGDGRDDVIVGASGHDPDGAAYVVFGKASGFANGLNLSGLDGTRGFQIDGAGVSVSGGADVNGDGLADIVVNSKSLDHPVSVIYGSDHFDTHVSVSSLDGNNGFTIANPWSPRLVGVSPETAMSDVNGDGLADIMVGAVKRGFTSGSETVRFDVCVVFGQESGGPATVDLSELDGHNGFSFRTLKGQSEAETFHVASAGDINGDGVGDLVMGGSINDETFPFDTSTQCYVLFGSVDGFQAHFRAATLDGTNGFGIATTDQYLMSVASAGDFNGDGYDDLLVASVDGPNGTVSVVFGASSGFGKTFDLSSLDGNNGFQIDAASTSVSAAGDINADGFDDLFVGTPNTGDSSGASFVLYGHKPSESTTVVGSAIGNTIHGSDSADALSGNSGSDRLIGYYGNDFLDGGDGDDNIDAGAGNDVLVGGDGNDTLEGGASADTLDGGAGVDRFVFSGIHDSPIFWYDTVIGADFAVDKWDMFSRVRDVKAPIKHGTLSTATFTHDLLDAVNKVPQSEAVLFTPDSGDLAGETYLFVNNHGAAGTGWSFVVHLVDAMNVASMDVSDFI